MVANGDGHCPTFILPRNKRLRLARNFMSASVATAIRAALAQKEREDQIVLYLADFFPRVVY